MPRRGTETTLGHARDADVEIGEWSVPTFEAACDGASVRVETAKRLFGPLKYPFRPAVASW
jgi:hypothetical protein